MPMLFNADEVFEMAEQIEVNGARFYRAAAKKFPALAQMLLELAAMEDEHQKTFAAMHAELSAAEQQQLVFDPDGEAQMYLRVMADGNVFENNWLDAQNGTAPWSVAHDVRFENNSVRSTEQGLPISRDDNLQDLQQTKWKQGGSQNLATN